MCGCNQHVANILREEAKVLVEQMPAKCIHGYVGVVVAGNTKIKIDVILAS
jgi:hypothetical protein